ncbi:MAG TPA: hypothetical protein VFQ45_20665 [Longimicrobium sp.]|nr:hypothetical protein [Longimicrobium sp.]
MKTMKLSLPLALVMALSFSAAPALAQGKGKGQGNGNGRPDQTQVREDRRDDDDDDDRDERRLERRRQERRDVYRQDGQRRRVPRGWCQGRGNPHNTVENCGVGSGRRRSNGTYVDRYDPDYNRSGTYSRSSGSYAQAHQEFHAWHDRECRRAAGERPLDLNHQVRVRTECKARHDEFHRQWGVAHR